MSTRNGRRRFLRGLGGVAVALPFLETLAPRRARAGEGDVPPFAIFVRQGNGVAMETGVIDGIPGGGYEPERYWPSAGPGLLDAATLSADTDRALSELGGYAGKMNILRGIDFISEPQSCAHAAGGALCLTAARLGYFPDDDTALIRARGESIDNRIVRELMGEGAEPLTLYAGLKYGGLDEVLSYRGEFQLRAAQNDPYQAYMDLFGLSGLDDEAFEELRVRRQSVNDVVRQQMVALLARTDLSKADRQRLDLHFTAIRDLETGITCGLGEGEVADLATIGANANNDDYIEQVFQRQSDIIALTMACGLTRAATLQIGNGGDATQYWIDGEKQRYFHSISHRTEDDGETEVAGADVLHHQIDRKLLGLFRYLLDKLDAYQLGDGTLLDHGVTVFLNDLANKYHYTENVPHILVGGAHGALHTGLYLDAGGTSNARLLSTIGAALGCRNGNGEPLDDFGNPDLEPGRIEALVKV